MDLVKQSFNNNDIVKVLKIKSFFNLMLSEFFSQIAFNMQHFVLIFIIYEIYKRNSAVSGVILSFTIPAIFFSVVAGIYVDKWNKKKVLFATNFIRGLILLFFLIPNTHLAYLYGLTFLIAVATQFFLPAEAPIIPQLVKKDLVVPANAVFGIGIYTTVLIGYILSGPALIYFGKTNIFIFLSLLFFLGAFLILFVKTPREKNKKEVNYGFHNFLPSFLGELGHLVKFIKKTKEVTGALMLLTIAQTIIFIFAALGPGYVSEILDVQLESLSWMILGPAAIGMVIGSLIIGSLNKRIKIRKAITLGFFLAGIMFFLLPFGSKVESYQFVKTINSFLPRIFEFTIIHMIIFIMFILGIANSLVFVPANTTIQTKTSEQFRGRVYGLLNALISAVSLLPVAIAGGFADIFGVGRVLTSIGVFLLLFTIFRLIWKP